MSYSPAMKIILSRKGFDSTFGGVASPILPSGELCSLPIPEYKSQDHNRPRRYEEIMLGNETLGKIVSDLTRNRIKSYDVAHLDPDLSFESIPRPLHWKPLFGQAGAAEKHLRNQGVKQGDVFLFFGWFRQVEEREGVYQYVQGAPDLHVVFGWLQIERRIGVEVLSEIPEWASDHPHYKEKPYSSVESIYLSKDYLELPNLSIKKRGAGVFKQFHPALCLSCSQRSRSIWRLPRWFYPDDTKHPLSYHSRKSRWTLEKEHVILQSVGRGQEFVLDCEQYPDSISWLSDLLSAEDDT